MQPSLRAAGHAIKDQGAIILSSTPVLWLGFRVLHRVHAGWGMWRKTTVYSNYNNYLKLIAGHTLGLTNRDSILGRACQTCSIWLMISVRILHCVEQKQAVELSCKRFKEVYTVPSKCRWKANNFFLVSPSHAARIQSGCSELIRRIQRTAAAVFDVFCQFFLLCMKMMDAVEAIFDTKIREEAVNEFFVNGSIWMAEIVKNEKKMMRSLEENHAVIESILQGAGFGMCADDLIKLVRSSIGEVKKVYGDTEQVSSEFGLILSSIGKKTLYGLAKACGMKTLLPLELVSIQPAPFSCTEEKRYPPVELMSKAVVKTVKVKKQEKVPSIMEKIWGSPLSLTA